MNLLAEVIIDDHDGIFSVNSGKARDEINAHDLPRCSRYGKWLKEPIREMFRAFGAGTYVAA